MKPTGRVGDIVVGGDISTDGDDVVTVDLEGTVGSLAVGGKIVANGDGASAIRIVRGRPNLDGLHIEAARGRTIVSES